MAAVPTPLAVVSAAGAAPVSSLAGASRGVATGVATSGVGELTVSETAGGVEVVAGLSGVVGRVSCVLKKIKYYFHWKNTRGRFIYEYHGNIHQQLRVIPNSP